MQEKKRINPSYRLKVRLLQETGGKCSFCSFHDSGRLEFHHIDEDSSNTIFENLIAVCPNCHSSINENKITTEEVNQRKHRNSIITQLFSMVNISLLIFQLEKIESAFLQKE